MSYDVIIVGAGAAGLAAAARLADTGLQVLLVERNPRVGKKLLSTGNGRCNLSNEVMAPALYYEAEPFVRELYRTISPDSVLSFFRSIGLMTTSEDGRIYPRTMAAASVLDLFRNILDRSPSITLITDAKVTQIRQTKDQLWTIQFASHPPVTGHSLILAAGGCAAPKTGTDGSGFDLLRSLGLPITPLTPALVQLKSSHPALPSLKGLRIQARLSLSISGEPLREETGELLFTDYGISGICVFQLSRYVPDALARRKAVRVLVHFLPELKTESVCDWLYQRLDMFRKTEQLQSCFTGVFQRMLTLAVIKEAGFRPDMQIRSVTPDGINKLCQVIEAFPLEITGTLGFDHAQITRGGLSRDAVNPHTMEILPGLYAAGEIIDCDGPCGGYNLHFAFTSGLVAAEAILSSFQSTQDNKNRSHS